MHLRILGCHGGETPRHHCPAFLIDSQLCLDAGAITRTLTIEQQGRLSVVVVSHPHMDHVRDLALLADVRVQLNCPPLVVASTANTIEILKTHFFNGKLWPDFTRIPSAAAPTIVFREMPAEQETHFGPYAIRPIMVNHSVEAAGFIVSKGRSALAYSGDTGPTDRFWQCTADYSELSALIVEVAFPNSQQVLATQSGHHTPQSLALDLNKLQPKQRDLPIFGFHIKPVFQQETERELAELSSHRVTVLQNDYEFSL